MVPAFAAMFSALGMLMARPGRVFTRAIYLPFAEIKDTTLSSAIQSLKDEAVSHADLADRGPRTDELAADVRYAGQSTTLEIPLSGDLLEMRAQFERAHETRYGHRLMQEPELVRIRWRAEDRHPLPRSVASLQQPDLAGFFPATHGRALQPISNHCPPFYRSRTFSLISTSRAREPCLRPARPSVWIKIGSLCAMRPATCCSCTNTRTEGRHEST